MSRDKLDYNIDSRLKLNFNISNLLVFGAGPCNISHRVRYALGSQCIQPFDEEFFDIMDEVKIMLRYIFQTQNPLTLAIQTSGNGGIEAIIANLLDPGDRILIAIGGIFGDIVVDIASRHGLDIKTLRAIPGEIFSLDELETGLIQHKPDLLFVTHGESSVGTIQNLDGLGKICHKYDCLLAVDAISSTGVHPVFVDRWEIDAICAGSQKGLGGPVGLCLLTLSPRAQQRMETKKKLPPYYLDLKHLASFWQDSHQKRTYHYSFSSNLIAALREALAEVCEEGLENVWLRHESNAKFFWDCLNKEGFDFFVKNPKNRFFGIHPINIPPSIDITKFLGFILTKYGIDITPGFGPSAGKTVRVGLMARNSRLEFVEILVKAMSDARDNVGHGNGCR